MDSQQGNYSMLARKADRSVAGMWLVLGFGKKMGCPTFEAAFQPHNSMLDMAVLPFDAVMNN